MAIYSSQVARNLKEAELLQSRWKDKVEIEPYLIFFPDGSSGKIYNQPLSWKLTERQKKNLRDGWNNLQNYPIIKDIENLWHTKWNMPSE